MPRLFFSSLPPTLREGALTYEIDIRFAVAKMDRDILQTGTHRKQCGTACCRVRSSRSASLLPLFVKLVLIELFGAQANPRESSLLITEPYFNLPNIQDVYDQFVFEEYEFDSYYRCTRV